MNIFVVLRDNYFRSSNDFMDAKYFGCIHIVAYLTQGFEIFFKTFNDVTSKEII